MPNTVDKFNTAARDVGQDFNRDFGKPSRPKTGAEMAYEDNPLLGLPPIDKQVNASDPIRTNGYYLIPPEPLGELARVYQIGAVKHSPRGWEDGLPWSEVADRIFRHFGRWSRGERFDLEDGQHNLASVAWAALALMEFEKTHPELDDIHG